MCAWRCGSSSNSGLVSNLVTAGIISSERVQRAMLAVDRGNYTLVDPYADSPQGIGHGATISAPHMHAHCLELFEKDGFLNNRNRGGGGGGGGGIKVLDVGCGSGYLCSAFAHLINDDDEYGSKASRSLVVGMDHIPQLVALARKNIEKDHPEFLKHKNIDLIVGDGRLGYPQLGPYDVIHVGAAAQPIPECLLAQLKSPGRMIIPVGDQGSFQELLQIDRDSQGKLTMKSVMGVMYVPLTDVKDQVGGGML